MNNLKGLSLGFFGTTDFSLSFLRKLYDQEAKISFVVSQPPSISGRGKKLNYSSVQDWAIKKSLDTFTPDKTSDDEFQNAIKRKKVDFLIVVAYGNLINSLILNFPKYLALNVHGSLLPRWRGAAPIQRAILAGDKVTGVSIMKVENKLDAGPIILDEKINISQSDTSGTIYEKMVTTGKSLLIQSIKKIVNGDFKYRHQDENLATYAKKIEKKETRIFWNESAEKISLKIRAFNPYPGAWTTINKINARIKILKAEVLNVCDDSDDTNSPIGFVSESLVVKCGDKFLKINELQKEGKKKMSANEYINGNDMKNCFFK